MAAPDPAPAQDPDLPLLQAFAAGDARASRALVDWHMQRLHSLAWRLLGDRSEAEDVVQETFLKLWQHAERWQPRARVATWLYQVALNAARDRYRRRRPDNPWQEDGEMAQQASPSHEPPGQFEQAQQQRRLQRALADLPERQREAILLFHFEQHSQRETAAIMQLSESALESLLSRARSQLRERLAEPASRKEIQA